MPRLTHYPSGVSYCSDCGSKMILMDDDTHDCAMPEIDRFDIAEGLNVLAHDFGLYALKSALEASDIGFRAGSSRDTYDGINDDGRQVYDSLASLATDADAYSVPKWCDPLLDRLRKEGSDDA